MVRFVYPPIADHDPATVVMKLSAAVLDLNMDFILFVVV